MTPGFKVTDGDGLHSISPSEILAAHPPVPVRKPFSVSSSLAATPAADSSGESGGGVTNGNRAASAPFTDDLLMDRAQLMRFMNSGPVVHSRDYNERAVGKDERDWFTFTWRDSAMVQGGIWIGAVIGLLVAFGLVLLLIFDWS